MSWVITGSEKNPVDLYRSQVSLLLHGDGANGSTTITDSSPTPKTVTAVGNAQISTAQSKFGGASIAFDGNGDYLTLPSSNDFSFGLGDFTVEGWVYFLGFSAADARGIFQQANSLFATSTTSSCAVSTRPVSGTNRWHIYANNTFYDSATTLNASTWYHFALVRNASNTRLYVNGNSTIGPISDGRDYSGTTLGIGSIYGTDSRYNHNGYIDEFRITKGVARYTTDFTPSAAPFPDI